MGATWRYRDRFEAQGILGARVPDTEEYVRVLDCFDLTQTSSASWFYDTLLTKVLRGLVVAVKITVAPPADTPGSEFLATMKLHRQLVFVSS